MKFMKVQGSIQINSKIYHEKTQISKMYQEKIKISKHYLETNIIGIK